MHSPCPYGVKSLKLKVKNFLEALELLDKLEQLEYIEQLGFLLEHQRNESFLCQYLLCHFVQTFWSDLV